MLTMNRYIADFTTQISEAFQIGLKIDVSKNQKDISNVLVCGLGGSGIGGDIVKCLVKNELNVPFEVSKDYTIPKYVNEETFLIICSYSGNTEETLSAMDQAIAQRANIFCITSGGKVAEIAKKQGLGCVMIPGGMPPRACLAYSFIQQLFVLYHLNLIEYDFQTDLLSSINLLDNEEAAIQQEAKNIAKILTNKFPIIYTSSNMQAVAVRLRQQLNENAKALCSHHVIPEMNHNELVGWRKEDEQMAVLFLRNENDHPQIQKRIEINKEIIKKYTSTIIEIYSKGNNQLERMLYLIHFGDWISCFLAACKKVDAIEVNVIDYLKSSLAKS